MSQSLAAVPADRRTRLAGVLAAFAVLLAVIAVLAIAGGSSGVAVGLGGVAGTAAIVLGLMAWGLVRSVQAERALQDLDEQLRQTLAAAGALGCGCGHDHDPDEMHVRAGGDLAEHSAGDGSHRCAADGGGADCAHDCDTCTLAALRSGGSSVDR